MSRKEMKQFLGEIKERGWTVEQRKAGHLKLRGPRGEVVFCAQTPSDHRSLENIQCDMRRAVRERKERERV